MEAAQSIPTGISSPSQEKSSNRLRKQSSIISILFEFLEPRDVALELWIWVAAGSSSILVLILPSMSAQAGMGLHTSSRLSDLE